ncbi:MAG TPA: hypothetical protein PLD10_08980, partial [Rhodopila sp.]|nr:hypothetical protein [Rhodopila sp.]
MTQQDHARALACSGPAGKFSCGIEARVFVMCGRRAYLWLEMEVFGMDLGNGFPVDLILFGMIAAFLVLRLRG